VLDISARHFPLTFALAEPTPEPAMSSTPRFDPDGPAPADAGVFGLPYTEAEAALVLLPVPWDATTSYQAGTAGGPDAILTASHQMDLFDLDVEAPYAAGIHMLPVSTTLAALNAEARAAAEPVIAGGLDADAEAAACARVDALCERMVTTVREETRRLLGLGKLVAIVGGDHSVPLGAIQALAEQHPAFGILHFDAHHDLRDAYMGFRHSHASIMFNVMQTVPQVTRLVQVGIRDFGAAEHAYARDSGGRIAVFYDQHLAAARAEGVPWKLQVERMVAALPDAVYVSFDVDGLDPAFCPHTGTPVPGGLHYEEALQVLRAVVRSGRRIIGFDLVEVAPAPDAGDEWDANVGMRLIYRMAALTLASQGKARFRAG
jgi:agmatinase